jgi:hypothetical protein
MKIADNDLGELRRIQPDLATVNEVLVALASRFDWSADFDRGSLDCLIQGARSEPPGAASGSELQHIQSELLGLPTWLMPVTAARRPRTTERSGVYSQGPMQVLGKDVRGPDHRAVRPLALPDTYGTQR